MFCRLPREFICGLADLGQTVGECRKAQKCGKSEVSSDKLSCFVPVPLVGRILVRALILQHRRAEPTV